MASQEKNNIQITRGELCALWLLNFGAFSTDRALKYDPKQTSKSGKAIALVAKNIKAKSSVNLLLNGEICGNIKVKSTCKVSEDVKKNSVFENLRAGDQAIEGEVSLQKCKIWEEISRFLEFKSHFENPKISAFFTMADPLHCVHERLLRLMIDKADFVVIFLVGTNKPDTLNTKLRKKTLEFLCENFLVKERVMIVDLSDYKALDNHLDPILECAIAHNLGANKVVLGQKHKHVASYFDGNRMRTILDKCDYDKFEIWLMPEYVYCNKCKVLASVKNCPHGSHHHVHYHSRNLKALLHAGILPPAILMRKEISAMILSELFPSRFSDLQKLYDDLFPNDGLLEPHSENDFYEQLMKLYQTSALKT